MAERTDHHPGNEIESEGPPLADPPGGGSGPPADIPPNRPGRRTRRLASARSVSDRLTIYVVRGLFFLVAGGLGVQGAQLFASIGDLPKPPLHEGILIACGVAALLIFLEMFFARSPIRTVAAIAFGLLMGLVLSLVFQYIVQMIVQAVAPNLDPDDQRHFLSFLNLLTTCIFCYFGVSLLLETKDDFKFIIPFVEFRKQVKDLMPLILDTSVFIDGRFQALLATGLVDERIEIPRFVLDELQGIADSPDRSLRERGRRGMDILDDVQNHHWVDVVECALAPGEPVDTGLIRLAELHEGKIVTTDYNLTKRARLQGVSVLNINDVANAFKPSYVGGEALRVRLLRPGEEAGQAVGFLDDGTMVVVEASRDRIGQIVPAIVTSAIQTSAGKMLFARLKTPGRSRARR